MATVTFNEPTNVYALPTSVAFTGGTFPIPGSSSNDLEFYSGSVSESFLGVFNNFGGGVSGTIDKAWIDNGDIGYLPNLEFTGLSYTLDVFNYNLNITTGNLFNLLAGLLAGDDTLFGSYGNDTIVGFGGSDTMFGGPGGGSVPDGSDSFNGDFGIDTVSYANAPAGLLAALDILGVNTAAALGDTYDSVENLIGSAFADTLYGSAAVNRLSGGGGNDTLYGGAGGDTFDGGAGSDTAAYNDGFAVRADLLLPGTNTGDAAGDVYISIENLAGSLQGDVLLGDNAANVISGNFFPNFASGADQLFGRGGNDRLNGNDDNDLLNGGLGNDILNGGIGSDTLFGGAGNDTLAGGANADFFVFNTALSAITNRDIVTDFSHVDDTFRLENSGVFTKLTALGTLNPAFFRAGAAALDANDFIVYNQATGVLSYDFNGNVAGGAIVFAVLANHAVLAYNDFVVI